ncbi:hypothetical protein BSKO_07831 [Bryopsis sp. KO-2023]|nr:hypothetical protein BSKO_07831 [Bryopsis sp. KO-2023]
MSRTVSLDLGATSDVRPPLGTPDSQASLQSPSTNRCSCGENEKFARTCSFGSDSAKSNCPPHGVKAVCGRRSKMEDMYVIQPNFIPYAGLGQLEPVLPPTLETGHIRQLSTALGDWDGTSSEKSDVSKPSTASADSTDSLHLFAVYDGHGGVEAAKHCSERMHANFLEAWEEREVQDMLAQAEEEHLLATQHNSAKSGAPLKRTHTKSSEEVASVFHKSFMTTDKEFIQDDQSALVGSTAVVSLVGPKNVFVGYCGDSRAVLCRNGRALPLTVDHKPERDDETERVQDAGGQVLFFNGARVMGLLAMSRAIGDRSLRPFVIPDPEVTIIHRLPEDELLILATDGLWDVVSNQEACTLAMRCMQRAREKGACEANAARLTATVLTRAAMDRGSRDNITVVVVDLRPSLHPTPEPTTSSPVHERKDTSPNISSASPCPVTQTPVESRQEQQSSVMNVCEDRSDNHSSHMYDSNVGGGFEISRGVPVQVHP